MADSTLSPDDAAAFRQRCVDFLEGYDPPRERSLENSRRFLLAAADAGLGGLVYPVEYGGAGLTKEHERIWRSEKAKYGSVDSDFVISHGMCLPVMNDFASDELKREFLPDVISGKTMWCQMFSEPGAGSDVASLQTRAELDGDEWIINGQKVWTTLAHHSDYGVLIARTDPDQPKHAGISMFMIDMRAPGVEIRPIHQIDGGKHFNEVFFTDLRVPKHWLLGEKNNGWRQATAMLMYERVAIGGLGSGDISQPIFDQLVKWARKNEKIDDPVVRDELMQIYAMETTKAMVSMRTRAEMKAGKAPGPGGSLGKLFGSKIHWRFRDIAQGIAGMESIATDGDAGGEDLWKLVLNSFQSSIAGGTDEIQRNIIGDRVLGLPREPAVDRDVPFRDLKVGTQRD
ncbi:MAG: dehydrogenase [Acidimicrobiales bacterium]|nr:dehydrogenase [Acidimicrobiales bacterium]RZV46788.1 MAG: dehydrogenase [Acidimicrobiales bacterium]